MAESDRPLPTPPRQRFGGPSLVPGEPAGPAMADRMAQAAAAGRLEEFLQQELPEGEHARELARMMFGMTGMAGMTGMLPPGMSPASGSVPAPAAAAPAAPPSPAPAEGAAVPPAVLAAVEQGDVAALASLLRAEHERRAGGAPAPGAAPVREPPIAAGAGAPAAAPAARPAIDAALIEELVRIGADKPPPAPAARPAIDAALIEELVRIGADNDVGVDWLMLRAVRLYVEEHRRSGRL